MRSAPVSGPMTALVTLVCVLGLGCSDGPVAPVDDAAASDPQALALRAFLGDPWMAGMVDGIADPGLRLPFARFAGDRGSLGRALQRAQEDELTPDDRIAAAILELSLMAAERAPRPESSR